MSSNQSDKQTTAERITLGISVLILAAIIGLAVWADAQTGDVPPNITVEADLENVRETDTGFYVPITIINTGGITAQDVTVTGELDQGEENPETAEITLSFLAGGEEESAEFVFSAHPNEGEFTVGPTSYVQP